MDGLAGKRLLILGGPTQHKKVVTAAKELGVYTIVTDIAEKTETKDLADEALPYSVLDYDALLKWCKENPVDGILNFCVNTGCMMHQRLCEALGLPCFGTYEQYQILSDKTLFKKLCKDNGVDIIPDYSEEQAITGEIEYPVIVKPADSAGSMGVSICGDKEEVLRAIDYAKKKSSNGKILIERYMGGKPDMTVTFLLVDGIPYLTRLLDRIPGNEEDGLDRQCICGIVPSRYTELYLNNVHSRVVRMLQKLGVQNGPVFMQGFVDGDTIRFYDPAIRFPGGNFEIPYRETTGVDLMKALVGYSITGHIDLKPEELEESFLYNGKCSVSLCLNARPGTISAIKGVEEIRQLPGVMHIAQKAFAGDQISKTGDVKQRVLEFYLLTEKDPHELRKLTDRIYSLLRVEDENGENMLISLPDPAERLS